MNDTRPWVPWPANLLFPPGARVREEWTVGDDTDSTHFIHPDDVPVAPDPDADLIERIAKSLHDAQIALGGSGLSWEMRGSLIHDAYRQDARLALSLIRESEATA